MTRFLEHCDESAFGTLVDRHGGVILGLCRRLVGDEHLAEDVFQATFLALARNASSIRRQGSLGSWLYGVAYRIAQRARVDAARRRRLARTASATRESNMNYQNADARSLLEEELHHLPPRLREPVILHHLEGLTGDEAAHRLGYSVGTLWSRLSRARQLLKDRLTRRGVALSAFAALLQGSETAAALPWPLRDLTASAAIRLAKQGDRLALGTTSQTVLMAQGALKEMLIHRIVRLTGLAVFALVVSLGIGVWALSGPKQEAGTTEIGKHPALPEGAFARLGDRPAFQSDATINACALAANGKVMAGIDSARDLHVWSMPDGAPVKRFGKTEGKRLGWGSAFLALSPDGKLAFAGDEVAPLRVLDIENGKDLGPLEKGTGGIAGLAMSADGKLLAALSDSTTDILLWDVEKTKLRRRWALPDSGYCLAFAPDGKSLATGGSKKILFWNLTDDKPVKTWNGHEGNVTALAFAPDSRSVAAGDDGQTIALWDCQENRIQKQWKSPSGQRPFVELAFSADGTKLVSCAAIRGTNLSKSVQAREAAHVWDAKTGTLLHTLEGDAPYPCPILTPDGKKAAIVVTGGVRLFDGETGRVLANRRMPSTIQFSADSKTLLALSSDEVLTWKVATQEQIKSVATQAQCTALDGWNQRVAVSSKDGLKLIDVKTGQSKQLRKTRAIIQSLLFSPDGKRLAVVELALKHENRQAMPIRQVILIDMNDGKPMDPVPLPDTESALFLAFSQDGATLACLSGTPNATCTWIDAATGKKRADVPMKNVQAGPTAFLGQTLAVLNIGQIRLVEIGSGCTGTLVESADHCFTALRASADGKWIAVDRFDLKTGKWSVAVVDTETGEPMTQFHEGRTHALAFSPDGKLLATADAEFCGIGPMMWFVNRPDATTAVDGILVWDLTLLKRKKPELEKIGVRDVPALWESLAGTDLNAARKAMAVLAGNPQVAIAAIAGKTIARKEVDLDPEKIRSLIAKLDDVKFEERERAKKELTTAGPKAAEAVRKALENKDLTLEMRRRLESVLDLRAEITARDARLWGRVVETLDRIGNAEAQAELTTLAKGDGPEKTRAAACLKRMKP